jgi:hypothetical protein
MVFGVIAAFGCGGSGGLVAPGDDVSDPGGVAGNDVAIVDSVESDAVDAEPDGSMGGEEDGTPDIASSDANPEDTNAPDGEAVPVENCANGVDDDGDGFADCADAECLDQAGPCTVEAACDDGFDNDDDGLVDCLDDNCLAACSPANCQLFRQCLVATGCGCTYGYDCPETPEELGGCYWSCLNSGACLGVCEDKVGSEVYEKVLDLDACMGEQCQGAQGEDYGTCMIGQCLDEAAVCYYLGDDSCSDVYFQCFPGCGGDEDCMKLCGFALSSEGFKDGVAYDGCWKAICDKDKDGQPDDPLCAGLAGNLACSSSAPGCKEGNFSAEGDSCAETFDKTIECLTTAGWPCVEAAVANQGMGAMDATSKLFYCALDSCMTFIGGVSAACLVDATVGPCAEEAQACFPEAVDGDEICDSGLDDDDNGLIDCEDPACTEDPDCEETPEPTAFNYLRIQEHPNAVIECVEPGGDQLTAPGADIDAILLTGGGGQIFTPVDIALLGTPLCDANPYDDKDACKGLPDGLHVSLNGRTLVMGHPEGASFASGDVITIYEVEADSEDSYIVTLSTGPFQGESLFLGEGKGTTVLTVP